MNKFDHVRQAKQTRAHTCHWPGCKLQVTPAMWGCKHHWYKLPKYLRDRIWRAYRQGQEERMDPSEEYLKAAREVEFWIKSLGVGK